MTRLALALLLMLFLSACGDEMADQAKLEVYETTDLFPDGSAQQTPVPGTFARGELDYFAVLAERPPLTEDLLRRGKERYRAFCWPCHGGAGDGQGVVVQRGFPSPPSYHIERLRTAPDRHIMNVIRDGYGVMYPYAARVPPADRWAIAAYVRALQLSQHAALDGLPERDRAHLREVAP
jgi:mono/diheme cytochrome c family protein